MMRSLPPLSILVKSRLRCGGGFRIVQGKGAVRRFHKGCHFQLPTNCGKLVIIHKDYKTDSTFPFIRS